MMLKSLDPISNSYPIKGTFSSWFLGNKILRIITANVFLPTQAWYRLEASNLKMMFLHKGTSATYLAIMG